VSGNAPMSTRYDAVVCDLDGVVYRGPRAIPHAVEALAGLEVPVLYATNNASRAPEDVAAHLVALGLPCDASAVATSSQAGVWVLDDRVQTGGPVLAVGGPGVAAALRDGGFEPVLPADVRGSGVRPLAVLQGYGPDVTASDLAEAAYAVQSGALWVATNADATLPTDRGIAPGNGSLVGAVQNAVGHAPDVIAGKPAPPLYLLCAERLGVEVRRVLAVGDRLDTDIEGAVAAGMDSLFVLTGVDDLEGCLKAPPNRRPTFVAPDLRALRAGPDSGSGVLELTAAVTAVHQALDAGADDRSVEHLFSAAEVLLRTVAHR
jgi:glycerol 3-phosphatase-2